MSEKTFLEDCRCAKIVDTPYGRAIMIGGFIFEVREPAICGIPYLSDPTDYLGLFVKALRSSDPSNLAGENSPTDEQEA